MSEEGEGGVVVDEADARDETEDLSEQVSELSDQVADLEDRLTRALADKANLRKRLEGRIAEARRDAKEDLLVRVVRVAEDLDRALEGDLDPRGVRMVRDALGDVLADEDVEAIRAEGETFDPRYHEAVARVETDEVPDGQVVEEVQAGYTFGDDVLVHSKVAVARAPTTDEEE